MNKTRQFGALAAAVLALSGAVIAQDSAASQRGVAAKVDEQKVMVVGCLRWTEPTPTGTTIGLVEYTLTNATTVDSNSTAANVGTPAATGTSGNAAANAKGMTYALAAEKLEELKKYENQRVEITGWMAVSPPPPAAAPETAGSKPHSATNAPRLRVAAVKVVGGSCDAK